MTINSIKIIAKFTNDDKYYGITIEVDNEPYAKIFRSHVVILNYCFPYLRRILSTKKKKNDETLVHIKLSGNFTNDFKVRNIFF